MSVSRRGFLQGLGVGRTSHAAAFMAARGHEELMAEAMQQGRQGAARMRPNLPPGVEAIRISSSTRRSARTSCWASGRRSC